MYSLDWGLRILKAFFTDRTRTINIDLCILQEIKQIYHQIYTDQMLHKALLRSITQPKEQALWRDYKKLVKCKSFDRRKLEVVVHEMIRVYDNQEEFEQQLTLF